MFPKYVYNTMNFLLCLWKILQGEIVGIGKQIKHHLLQYHFRSAWFSLITVFTIWFYDCSGTNHIIKYMMYITLSCENSLMFNSRTSNQWRKHLLIFPSRCGKYLQYISYFKITQSHQGWHKSQTQYKQKLVFIFHSVQKLNYVLLLFA